MKLRVLSLMIPAVLFAGAASAAEIYNKDGNILDLNGKVDAEHYFSKNDGVDGDQSYLRFGFNGQTKISDQLTGYGQWEYQAALNSAEEEGTANSYTRVGFAGLKFGDWGSLDYGRNYGVLYDIGSWTDVLPEFGGDTYTPDNFMEQRGNDLLTYRASDFFGLIKGLNIALQYQGKNDNPGGESSGRSAQASNGDGYGMSAIYDFGMGLSVAGAYTSSNRTTDQNELDYGRANRAKAASVGLKYDANNVYLAAMVTHTKDLTRIGDDSDDLDGFANKATNFEAVAQYQFDSGLRPSLAFLQSRGKGINSDSGLGTNYGTQNIEKYIDIGTYYYFNKNMSTFIDYKLNLMKTNDFTDATGINTKDVVAVGLIYQF